MKRILSVILMVVIAVGFAGCGSENANTIATPSLSVNVKEWNSPSLDLAQQLNEITYNAPSNWRAANATSPEGMYYYPYESNSDGLLYVCCQPLTELDGADVSDAAISKSMFDDVLAGMIKDKDVSNMSDEQYTNISGCPAITVNFNQDINGVNYECMAYLFFSTKNLYSIIISEPSLSEDFIDSVSLLVGDIDINEEAKPKSITQKIELAKQEGVEIIYSDYSKSQMSDGLFNSQYIIATGMASDISRSVGCSFDFYEKTDDGFASSYIYISESDSPIEGIDTINNGDGVKIYGFINDEADFTVYAIEKAELDFTMESVVDDYKARCEKYNYKTIARDPDVYKGKMAQFTGEVIQVLESGSSVTLRVNVTKGKYSYEDTVYVTYTRKSDTESRILEDDIVAMWGTFAGLQTYETILGGSVTIPKFNAEYIEIES